MNFFTKLFLLCLIFFISYVLLVLSTSPLGDSIGKTFGLEKFNEFIKNSKGTLDEVSTKDYSKDINNFKSGAIETWEKTQKTVTDGVNGVKDTVDGIRSGVNDGVELYEDTKQKVEDTVGTINETTEKIGKVKDALSGSGNKK